MATLDELELRLRALEQAQAAEPTSYYTSIFSGEEMDQRLAAAGVLGTASTPQEALAALGAAVRPNLLDNPCFVGGGTGWGVFPVNQRGQKSYTGQLGVRTQSIDRWSVSYATLTLDSDGVQINSAAYDNSILQIVPNWDNLVGETVTVSVLVSAISGGTAILGINNVPTLEILAPGIYQKTLVLPAGVNRGISLAMPEGVSIKVQAMKLEVGDTQTLAYQKSDGTWAMLPQHLSYQQELAKCQAYQIELNPYKLQNPTLGTVTRGPGSWYCAIALPATMRTSPTLKIDRGTPTVECPDGAFPVSQLTLLSATSGMALFVLTFSGSTPSAASSGTLYIAGTGSGADAPSVLLNANL